MGRRRDRMKLRSGVVGNLTQTLENASNIANKVVVDKDKALELNTELQKIRAGLLLSGKGASITKITICGLVTLVTLVGSYVFLTTPTDSINMVMFKDYALSITPVIGLLIGAYSGGKTIQRVIKRNG